ncbi:hypothetical protein [Clostridium beijerinckii]|uniref:hypothetical protein n=1 Tax=Clostridium beijerinckii TaxID=1520 RepID=UPI00047E2625|nr:hypothetical protein [Clostridium beijerinckii]
MIDKHIEIIDLTYQQYEALIKMQMKAYYKIFNSFKENISDPEKVEEFNRCILSIDKQILNELNGISDDNKEFFKYLKEN